MGMEGIIIRGMEFHELKEGEREMTLRLRNTRSSFKKPNFMEFCECVIKRRKQISILSFKCLVGWEASYSDANKWCSVSQNHKSKSALLKWARAATMAAKVAKGLSKDDKAQKLALRHWLEAIDRHHRYGHNLHFYYHVWLRTNTSQPFFYWLDIGDGKEANVDDCPRHELQKQCIRYLGPKEREAYEVSIDNNGRLVYRESKGVVHTPEGSKWIFVLSSCRILYVGEKKKGIFHHSSFLAGAATIASGRLVAFNGVLDAIWPYSGHYSPTEENFMEFIDFLEEHNVDLTHVKKYAVDDDVPPSKPIDECDCIEGDHVGQFGTNINVETSQVKEKKALMSRKWSSRIACETEYPKKIQFLQALNLSPRVLRVTTLAKFSIKAHILNPSSPRITPKSELFMNNLVNLFLMQ